MADPMTHIVFHVATKAPDPGPGEAFAHPIQHRLRAVSIMVLVEGKAPRMRTFGSSRGFFKAVGNSDADLTSWNGRGFGLPVLVYDAMREGVDASVVMDRRYTHRYDSRHFDVADVMGFHGAARHPNLEDASQLVGMPGRFFDPYEKDETRIITALEIDVVLICLARTAWSAAAGGPGRWDDVPTFRRLLAKRARKRFEDGLPKDLSKYLSAMKVFDGR